MVARKNFIKFWRPSIIKNKKNGLKPREICNLMNRHNGNEHKITHGVQ